MARKHKSTSGIDQRTATMVKTQLMISSRRIKRIQSYCAVTVRRYLRMPITELTDQISPILGPRSGRSIQNGEDCRYYMFTGAACSRDRKQLPVMVDWCPHLVSGGLGIQAVNEIRKKNAAFQQPNSLFPGLFWKDESAFMF